MQLGMTHKHPVILAAPIGLGRGPTPIPAFGEMVHHSAHLCAMGELPCAWHGKDGGPVQVVHEFERDVGGIARIGHHAQLAHPRRGLKVFAHLPEQDVLVPLALGVNGSQSYGDAQAIPLAMNPIMAKPKGEGDDAL
jgi:hypothetical protein